MEIEKMCEEARYSDVLEKLVGKLSGKEVLFLEYDSDYSGYVDIDVLLEDGRVFSYKYWYGSCSGCDEWESNCLTDSEIMRVMEKEATFWDNEEQYREWADENR